MGEIANLFILHESQGFEAAEEENFRQVQEFLRQRDATVDIKDQVHAVWYALQLITCSQKLNKRIKCQRLCMPTPIAGSRFLETGVEDILKLKMSGKLGKRTIVFLNLCA